MNSCKQHRGAINVCECVFVCMCITKREERTKEDTIPPMNSCKQHRREKCVFVYVCMCN